MIGVSAFAMLAACASAPKGRSAPSASRPMRNVPLVIKAPRAADFRFVGKVEGVAELGEWVSAANHARIDIQRKAEALGADLVQIDRVIVPDDGERGRLVLLTGRAYRAVFKRGDD